MTDIEKLESRVKRLEGRAISLILLSLSLLLHHYLGH